MDMENRELRAVYAETMMALAAKDERIVMVEADLMRSCGMMPFSEAYPERTVDVGVAEANMMGIAAGLSAMGKIPFAHSFSPFVTRRCFDQMTVSVAYAGLNVKIIGSDPGICAEVNGGTHMSFDDVSMMRGVPGMTIVEPIDAVSMRELLPLIAYHKTPVYMRLFRKTAAKVYQDGARFEIGKANTVREGGDAAILASGIMVANALAAAAELEREGISVRVVDMHTIKPLDTGAVLGAARECKAIVSAENHNIFNGLGSAVSEVLAENRIAIPFRRVGVKDRFGIVGFRPFLEEEFELAPRNIAAAVKEALRQTAR